MRVSADRATIFASSAGCQIFLVAALRPYRRINAIEKVSGANLTSSTCFAITMAVVATWAPILAPPVGNPVLLAPALLAFTSGRALQAAVAAGAACPSNRVNAARIVAVRAIGLASKSCPVDSKIRVVLALGTRFQRAALAARLRAQVTQTIL